MRGDDTVHIHITPLYSRRRPIFVEAISKIFQRDPAIIFLNLCEWSFNGIDILTDKGKKKLYHAFCLVTDVVIKNVKFFPYALIQKFKKLPFLPLAEIGCPIPIKRPENERTQSDTK